MADPNALANTTWSTDLPPTHRQRIAAKLDEIIRDYQGPPPISMHSGVQLEGAIFSKAKSKDDYHQLVQKLITSLSRHRNLDPNAGRPGMPSAVQPGMPPTGPGNVPQGMGGSSGYHQMPAHHPQSYHTQAQPQAHHQQPQPYYQSPQPGTLGMTVRVPQQPQPPQRGGPPTQQGSMYDVMPNRPTQSAVPPRPQPIPSYQPRPAVPGPTSMPRPLNPATPGTGINPGSTHGPYVSYPNTSMNPPINTTLAGGIINPQPPPHPSPARPGPSVGPVPSPGMSMSPHSTTGHTGPPSVPSQADLAEYDAKIKELLSYIPLVKKMIDNLMRSARDDESARKSEHNINKLKIFLAAMQDPEKRLPMHMLDRWLDVLRKLNDPKPTPHPPPPTLELEPPSPPPSQNKLYGKRTKGIFSEDRIPAKFRKIASELTCMDFLERELECLEDQFKVATVRSPTDTDKTAELQCFIEDDGLPKVPPLKITLTSSYPDSCPEVDTKEYTNSFKFLDIVQQHLKKWMQSQSSSFLLSNLLQAWESSIKLALRDVLSQKE